MRKEPKTFEGAMSVMARKLGLTRKADIKKYITVTLALQRCGYLNDGNFDFDRTDSRAKFDYRIELMVLELRETIEGTKKGRKMLEKLGIEEYSIPVPERGHRVFELPTSDDGYKQILERMNRKSRHAERLG